MGVLLGGVREQRRLNKEFLEATIRGLVRELDDLAPAPASSFSGPQFLKSRDLFNKAADYDGMLGAMMLESFMMAAFYDVANDNGLAHSLSDAAEMMSEYLEETHDERKGKGSFARLKDWNGESAISPSFNEETQGQGKRRKIEAAIAHRLREYDALPAFHAA